MTGRPCMTRNVSRILRMQRVGKLIDWFIPEGATADPQAYLRCRLLVIATPSMAVTLYIMVGLWFWWMPAEGPSAVVGLSAFFSAIVLSTLPFLLKKTGSTRIPGAIWSLDVIIATTVASWITGGMPSPPAVWLIFPPVLGFYLVGRKWGLFTAIISMGVMTVFFIVEQMGYTFPDPVSVRESHLVSYVSLLFCALVLLLFAGAYEASRRAASRRLEAARDQARESNRAKSMFLANMSHEIRTPLNAVIGLNSLLLDTKLDPEQKRFAETVRTSGEMLLFIVNDILDFVRIEARKIELEDTDFDMRECLDEIADVLSPKAREGKIDLRVNAQPDVPRRVRGDPGRLRQVLLNLAGNAVKFTHQGEVRLLVERVDVESNGNGIARLRFRVRDTGIGIAPENLEKLFEPFSQADGSTTRQYGGTGLGLTISQQLVTAMGGSIRVSSRPGRGTEFFFELDFPVAPDRSPEQARDPEDSHFSLSIRNILVVEDYSVNQLLMTRLFEKMGMRCDIASNGKEAVEAVDGIQYDLILMDLQMPVMDGYQASIAIRELEKKRGLKPCRIIALTADAVKGTRERCLAMGMDDYVTKPIMRGALISVMKKYFG